MLSPLYSAKAIAERVQDIADHINSDYKDVEALHVVVTLNGAFMFAADLVRKLEMPQVIHFAGAQSYLGTQQGDLRVNADALPRSFGNQPVLIIEDIMDSGRTAKVLRALIAERFSGSIGMAALLRRQNCEGDCDYYGFTVPRGLFVVGYGMDMDGRYRELTDIRAYDNATMSSSTSQGLC